MGNYSKTRNSDTAKQTQYAANHLQDLSPEDQVIVRQEAYKLAEKLKNVGVAGALELLMMTGTWINKKMGGKPNANENH